MMTHQLTPFYFVSVQGYILVGHKSPCGLGVGLLEELGVTEGVWEGEEEGDSEREEDGEED